ncbi:MAG: hypothetical protein J7K87_03630 [Candidatus Aenigmarchaeota archaeon]|nr:hypothetical protein [Candidatus Aenigmarchaeota archaeon]
MIIMEPTYRDLINYLKKSDVPVPIAQKIFFRVVHRGKRPTLPGLMDEYQIIEYSKLGRSVCGIVSKDLLSSKDKEFYNKVDNTDILNNIYGDSNVAKLFFTSDVVGGYERLFCKKVAEELNEKVEENGGAKLFVLGIGEAEEIPKIFSHVPKLKKKIEIYGIDSFELMLKKSEWLNDKGYNYTPIKGDVRNLEHLGVLFENSVITFNANTKGNFPRSERRILDKKISEVMEDDTVLYESLYYPPEDVIEEWLLAQKYFRLPALLATTNFDRRERRYEEWLTKPLFAFSVYNEYTNNVEIYHADFDFKTGEYKLYPGFYSHRFSEGEIKESAENAGLKLHLTKDLDFNMFVARFEKF